MLRVLGHDHLHDVIDPRLGRWRGFDGDELAIDSEDDRPADLDVNIGCAASDGGLQNALKDFHSNSLGNLSGLRQPGKRERIQLCLHLPGNTGEQHRYLVAGMPITVASHHHARALKARGRGGLQGNHHFRPLGNRRIATEFDAVFSQSDCVSGEV